VSVSAQALAADNKTLTQSLVQLKAQMQQQSEMRATAERQLSDERATVQSMKTQHLHMQSALTVSAVPGGLLLLTIASAAQWDVALHPICMAEDMEGCILQCARDSARPKCTARATLHMSYVELVQMSHATSVLAFTLLSDFVQDATAGKAALAKANQELQSQLEQQSKLNSALISQLGEAQPKVSSAVQLSVARPIQHVMTRQF